MILIEQSRLFETLRLFTGLEKLKFGIYALDTDTVEQLASLLTAKKGRLTHLSIHNRGLTYGKDTRPNQG